MRNKQKRKAPLQNEQWKKAAWAAVIGVSFGLIAASVSAAHHSHQPVERSAPFMVPVSANPVSVSAAREQASATSEPASEAQELERLKTRNRRLEALVSVLRHRETERQ